MKTYEELLAERDALAAQVAILKDAYGDLTGAINNLDDTDTDSEEIIDEMWGQIFSVMQDGWNSFSREPQQCLAEIKAEAGRAGFIAGYHKMHIEFVGSLASSEGAEFAANQYAAKVQQGEKGTWLKDSNVNGGKRQGGAE